MYCEHESMLNKLRIDFLTFIKENKLCTNCDMSQNYRDEKKFCSLLCK